MEEAPIYFSKNKTFTGKVVFAGDYYNTPGIRELCHELKLNNPEAIKTAAGLLVKLIPGGSSLIPIPSHYGFPTYNFNLALKMAELNNTLHVNPLILSKPNIRWYDAKMSGKFYNTPALFLNQHLKSQNNVFLLDNVFDTGTTLFLAQKLLDFEVNALVVGKVFKNL